MSGNVPNPARRSSAPKQTAMRATPNQVCRILKNILEKCTISYGEEMLGRFFQAIKFDGENIFHAQKTNFPVWLLFSRQNNPNTHSKWMTADLLGAANHFYALKFVFFTRLFAASIQVESRSSPLIHVTRFC